MIHLKTEREIEIIKESSLIVGKTLGEVAKLIRPGIRCTTLDSVAETFIRDNGAVPSFKNYNGYPATLCISVNDVVVHGIPGQYELKEGETRVSITPDVVAMLHADGLNVLVESGAGVTSGFLDEDYIKNGATVVNSAKEVWDNSKAIIKVKEPQKSEFQYFRPDLIIFSYLHLAVEEELTKELLKKRVTAIASESVETEDS